MDDEVLAKTVLDRYGRTYADEIGLDIAKNTPSPLFLWLVASLLFSARIGANIAAKTAIAIREAGWRTPAALAAATSEERVKVINGAGYARYDERTASMLGEDAALLEKRWGGDLRNLREEAGGDAERIVELLQVFKGIGPVGAGIFCREMQGVWGELYPFVDERARTAAAALGLPDTPAALAALVDRADFPRFVTGLVRVDLADAYDEIGRAA